MYIAVSGNLGSGKSTVAQGLAKAFNCDLYPRRSYNKSYIEDLFREPARWTTEAQVSFMVHKHDEIREGLDRGRLFVLDRSFDEEVQVFAERFHEDGTIDSRSMGLLRQLAADLNSRLEPPSLIVFCECPVSVCEARLKDRPRSYQDSYPADHLIMLDRKLKDWIDRQIVPVLSIHTSQIDYRDHRNVVRLAREIDTKLTSARGNQMDLFGDAPAEAPDGNNVYLPSGAGPSLLRARQVYLAAPFTARAERRTLSVAGNTDLFAGLESAEHIPTAYRRKLTGLANAIASHGYDVLLPHRDINRWGKRALPASEIARRCLEAVAEADCFVGLIAESFGSHAELAYALGLKKPSLVLVSAKEPTSFFGEGMSALPAVGVIRAKSIGTLARILRQTDPLMRMVWR
ncbi:MAG TPA: deoxynucleoside kinase [Allosphingosinicella sp.]|jgi:deoxyadenosine/deoxycytidine kinase/nucleoside 2-deoxyribosyltransferase|nr:deoxynucleoside kinase [Allosphingosinicella sp.]